MVHPSCPGARPRLHARRRQVVHGVTAHRNSPFSLVAIPAKAEFRLSSASVYRAVRAGRVRRITGTGIFSTRDFWDPMRFAVIVLGTELGHLLAKASASALRARSCDSPWWSGAASIRGPRAFQARALPTELPDLVSFCEAPAGGAPANRDGGPDGI